MAIEIGASFYFVSAFKNINVDEAFEDMAQQIKKKFYVPDLDPLDSIKLSK